MGVAQEAGCKLVIFVQMRQTLELDLHSLNAFEILILVTFVLDCCLLRYITGYSLSSAAFDLFLFWHCFTDLYLLVLCTLLD